MSTCPNEDLYCAFVDDEVSPQLEEKLKAHLSQCEKCRQIVNRYILLKDALKCKDIPDLDMNKSFEKLLLKRNSLVVKKQNTFLIGLRYKVIASAVAGVFLLAFLFVLLQHNPNYNRTYTLRKNEVKFTPIVPISYKQHKNIISNIDLRDVTNVIKTDNKYNKKIYKGFTDTFNTFTSLYAPLENNQGNFTVSMPHMNENISYNYGTNILIYTNLNKDVK